MEDLQINFTCTACRRPEVFERTLKSFAANLRGIDLKRQTLFLNVDLVPDPGASWTEVILIAGQFFRVVVSNSFHKPSFPAAVKWCFAQPTTRFFFHLEDDWELMEPFDIQILMMLLDSCWKQNRLISCVNLRAYQWPEEDSRLCLSPGLWRTDDAKVIAERLSTTANPEKQLRPAGLGNPEGDKHLGFYGKCIPEKIILKDIGREWLDNSGWRKEVPIFFTKWEKSEKAGK